METKTVQYFKLINTIKFTDGFEIKAGEKVMLVKEDADNRWLNVQLEDDKTKRIFWVERNEVKFHSEKTEKWSKSYATQHNIDIEEKWLENEQKNTGTSTDAGIGPKSKRSKTNNGTSGRSGKTTQKRRTIKSGTKKTGGIKTPAKKTASKKATKRKPKKT